MESKKGTVKKDTRQRAAPDERKKRLRKRYYGLKRFLKEKSGFAEEKPDLTGFHKQPERFERQEESLFREWKEEKQNPVEEAWDPQDERKQDSEGRKKKEKVEHEDVCPLAEINSVTPYIDFK